MLLYTVGYHIFSLTLWSTVVLHNIYILYKYYIILYNIYNNYYYIIIIIIFYYYNLKITIHCIVLNYCD